jgi:hypothetical protein
MLAPLGSIDRRVVEQTEPPFDAAYRQACFEGILREQPLIRPEATPGDRLLLKNAPDANVASIYVDSDGESGGPMVLEYPFVTGNGEIHLPSADELHEAIFCSVQGASEDEQESGRCLPD